VRDEEYQARRVARMEHHRGSVQTTLDRLVRRQTFGKASPGRVLEEAECRRVVEQTQPEGRLRR
jgi:hypothetical protein